MKPEFWGTLGLSQQSISNKLMVGPHTLALLLASYVTMIELLNLSDTQICYL